MVSHVTIASTGKHYKGGPRWHVGRALTTPSSRATSSETYNGLVWIIKFFLGNDVIFRDESNDIN